MLFGKLNRPIFCACSSRPANEFVVPRQTGSDCKLLRKWSLQGVLNIGPKTFAKWLFPICTEEVNMDAFWFFTTKPSTTCLGKRQHEHSIFRMKKVQRENFSGWSFAGFYSRNGRDPNVYKAPRIWRRKSEQSSPSWSCQSEFLISVKTCIDIILKISSRARDYFLFDPQNLCSFSLQSFVV